MPGASQPTPLKEISSRDLKEAGFYGLLGNANGFGIVVPRLLETRGSFQFFMGLLCQLSREWLVPP